MFYFLLISSLSSLSTEEMRGGGNWGGERSIVGSERQMVKREGGIKLWVYTLEVIGAKLDLLGL